MQANAAAAGSGLLDKYFKYPLLMSCMRLRLFLALLAAVLLFGCIAEENFTQLKKETIANKQTYDLDGDGTWDYAVYDFAPVNVGDGAWVHRTVGIARIQSSTYNSTKDLTDIDLNAADLKIDQFLTEKRNEESFCSKQLGLLAGKCVDVSTCTKLCAANSDKCRKMPEAYGEVIGGSIVNYVKDASAVDSEVGNAKNTLFDLRDAPVEKKNVYLSYIANMKNDLAYMDANPLMFQQQITLCQPSDYGFATIKEAALRVGNYTSQTTGYRYNVVIETKTTVEGEFSKEIMGTEMQDTIPSAAGTVEVASNQKIITESANGTQIKWSSPTMASKSNLLYYYYDSQADPDAIYDNQYTAAVKIRYIDLSVLIPANMLFMALHGLTGSWYFALGATAGLGLAAIMLLYTIFVFIIKLIEQQLAGKKLTDAAKKAFGKTGVRWKISLPIGVIALAIGFYIASFAVPQPFSVASILNMATAFNDSTGILAFVGVALSMVGIFLLYDGVENLVKITLLERIYGAAVREERSDYFKNVASLRERLKELKALVEELGAADFDVGAEYTVLTGISNQKVDFLEKKITPNNLANLEDYVERVEHAIESLKDRKKASDENWGKWKESIANMLAEKNEVTASSLMGVPASLRTWALARYVKEEGSEGLEFEKDVLKKKKTTLKMLIRELAKEGLTRGGVVIKNESVVASYFENERNTTVQTALIYKLRSYIHSLGKTMMLGEPASFVTVGDKSVFVLMTTGGYECGLFVARDKFKDAIDKWKSKIKTVSD